MKPALTREELIEELALRGHDRDDLEQRRVYQLEAMYYEEDV